MIPGFNSHADWLSVIKHAIPGAAHCLIQFAIFSISCLSAIGTVVPTKAYDDDQPAQVEHITSTDDTCERSDSFIDSGAGETPQTQTAKPDDTKDKGPQSAAHSSEKKGEWLLAPIPVSSP